MRTWSSVDVTLVAKIALTIVHILEITSSTESIEMIKWICLEETFK